MSASSNLGAIFNPYLRMLTGTNAPQTNSSVPGELWRVSEKIGQGYFWYYPLDNTMSVSTADIKYHSDIIIECKAADFFSFGKYNRSISDHAPYFDAVPDKTKNDSRILGFAWKHTLFSKKIPKETPLGFTSITLTPKAMSRISSRFDSDSSVLASAIVALDGGQVIPGMDEFFKGLLNVQPGFVSAPVFYESKIIEASALLVDWWENNPSTSLNYLRHVDRVALDSTLNYINSHLDKPLNLDILCKISCMSTSKLTGLFKQVIGQTPMEYVRKLRMEHAHKMLCFSDIALGEIAQNLGFSHQGSFSEAFKSIYGISPLAYRKSYSQHHGLNKGKELTPTEKLLNVTAVHKKGNHHDRTCKRKQQA